MNEEQKQQSDVLKKMVYYVWAAPIVAPAGMWAMAELNIDGLRDNQFRHIGEISLFVVALVFCLYLFHLMAKKAKCPKCEKLYFNCSYKKYMLPQKGCHFCGE